VLTDYAFQALHEIVSNVLLTSEIITSIVRQSGALAHKSGNRLLSSSDAINRYGMWIEVRLAITLFMRKSYSCNSLFHVDE
jgi:hypothetical protein